MADPDLQLRKFQKELSAGTVSLALLAVLAAGDGPMYGYLIAKRLERDGGGVLLLFATLHVARGVAHVHGQLAKHLLVKAAPPAPSPVPAATATASNASPVA